VSASLVLIPNGAESDSLSLLQVAAAKMKMDTFDKEDCKVARGLVKTKRAARKAAKNDVTAARLAFEQAKAAAAAACPARKPKEPKEPKSYTPDDFAISKANECAAGSKPVDYKTCHDQASNYQWPGQPAGRTQRWDEEDHDPEFGTGWAFMPPGCVLYTSWPTGSHASQVRWNPNENGRNDGHRAKICEKDSALLQVDAEKVSQACKDARAFKKGQRAELKAAMGVLIGARGELQSAITAKNEVCPKREPKEPKTYTPDDFAITKANECPEGSKPVDYETCHDQAANYNWPGQPAGRTQRWDEEDHDPEFGTGWAFMPPGCVLYTSWPTGSHASQVRWNPNENGRNDGHRAKICEKAEEKPTRVRPTKEEKPKAVLGEGLRHKGINGGTNCGYRIPAYGGDIPYSPACTRMILCEDVPDCKTRGITSPQTCMDAAEKDGSCEGDWFEWRTSNSHCHCNPKGRTWVPFTGWAPSVTYPMRAGATHG
jgi:hypothetical protein